MNKASIIVMLTISFGTSVSVWASELSDAEDTYSKVCSACHGADGKGVLPGVPDFTDKQGRLLKTDEALVSSIINGYRSEGSMMAMPPKGGVSSMTVDEAASIVKYMRSVF